MSNKQRKPYLSLNYVWQTKLAELLKAPKVAPRGMETRELLQNTFKIDMRQPVLTLPARKLSYRFMAAEAYWILTGDNRVETIAPYNPNISQFSDNGTTYFGAYGPKIMDQLPYVIEKLWLDNSSRQAGLTIWRENPPQTKDVPCTVSIFFSIRNRHLNAHVFMRSSDIWLGIPYDVFNFAMLGHMVCAVYNGKVIRSDLNEPEPEKSFIMPGQVFLTAASSHLYARHYDEAEDCLCKSANIPWKMIHTPENLFINSHHLLKTLKELRDTKPGDPLRWWEE